MLGASWQRDLGCKDAPEGVSGGVLGVGWRTDGGGKETPEGVSGGALGAGWRRDLGGKEAPEGVSGGVLGASWRRDVSAALDPFAKTALRKGRALGTRGTGSSNMTQASSEEIDFVSAKAPGRGCPGPLKGAH